MAKKIQTVIIVTAYGEDNYFQKKYEDLVGIYTSVKKAIKGAQADGMTNEQKDYLERTGAFRCLEFDLKRNATENAYQVEYKEEMNPKRKPCVSSYMFRTYNLD